MGAATAPGHHFSEQAMQDRPDMLRNQMFIVELQLRWVRYSPSDFQHSCLDLWRSLAQFTVCAMKCTHNQALIIVHLSDHSQLVLCSMNGAVLTVQNVINGHL